jgi:transposase-like protein
VSELTKAHARSLRRDGWTLRKIAAFLDVGHTTVLYWTDEHAAERQRAASREAKRRRTGTCSECGALTRYNGHSAPVSTLCQRCANRRNGAARRGQGPRQRELLALLAAGPMRFAAIRDTLGTTHDHLSPLLHQLHRDGYIVRLERGLYALAAQPSAEDGGIRSSETERRRE